MEIEQNLCDQMKLTSDQIERFEERGLKVPPIITVGLLGAADLITSDYYPRHLKLFVMPSRKRDPFFILNFADVIKKRHRLINTS